MLITFLTIVSTVYLLFFTLRFFTTQQSLSKYRKLGIQAESTIHTLEYVATLFSFAFVVAVVASKF